MVQTCFLALDFLLSSSQTLLTCLTKYFPSSHSILYIASQGHEHPGSFSSLLAIAMAMQSRVCPDYKKVVFMTKYTSFFCAKVSCLCVGSFSVILLSFFISCRPLHIPKLPSRIFPRSFRSGFTSLIVIHVHITYLTSIFIYSLLSLYSICSTLILFTFLPFPSSSEFFSFQIPFL